ncbi:Transcription factor MADS-box [Arabidopsis thaliana x Arabidopsis arenosa]|uniref:Transcription factor MADS-box n=1 Tax=Arabidopsis thaliana x Arabidopsis arenosa TaxID=1240361 RepID=A0A8T2A7A3_9BRAS|nr:Transcription factor MADS-box [Arabidopsis thaliana x Arabidopsis arenosa]
MRDIACFHYKNGKKGEWGKHSKENQISCRKMGRKKIKLNRIECLKERSSKYSKGKKSLFKKAKEVALLCDFEIIMIVVSPTDKPTLFHIRSKSFNKIYDRYCMLSLQEREERRAYTVKVGFTHHFIFIN